MSNVRRNGIAVVAVIGAMVGAARPLAAVDGVIEINQARALAGGPGDEPGFPVTIYASGSYRLTSNLSVGSDTDAILVRPMEDRR